ncbi:MAG TPA: tripartite tricarboxylate transporter substrate binding protein [Ramlibacter sp.]|nr:tripartite tricarboxylate transporter substrate binding protein [Ramlibacter sp.]
MKLSKRAFVLALTLAAGLGPSLTRAQGAADYPKAPVKLIVGFAPGGGVDLMARYLAKKLGERMGQPFVVENRAGASGNIGAAAVAKARPDGYTLLMTSVVHSINPSLFKSLPFDPVNDFAPVTTIGLSPICFAAHPGAPFKTLPELVAHAKAHPGTVSYSSAGGGTMMALGMDLFETMAGIKLLHVPYNSTGPSVQAAVAGNVQVVSSGCGAVEPFARSGQLRMLGTATAKPSELTPGVPTIADAGSVPGYEAASWQGILAPAGTPQAVIDKLSAEIAEVQKLPDVREFMAKQGIEPYVLPPARFAELVRSDIAKYQKIVKDSGVKLD